MDWAVIDPADPCGRPLGARSRICCELRAGHPGRHWGRGRWGKWFTWS